MQNWSWILPVLLMLMGAKPLPVADNPAPPAAQEAPEQTAPEVNGWEEMVHSLGEDGYVDNGENFHLMDAWLESYQKGESAQVVLVGFASPTLIAQRLTCNGTAEYTVETLLYGDLGPPSAPEPHTGVMEREVEYVIDGMTWRKPNIPYTFVASDRYEKGNAQRASNAEVVTLYLYDTQTGAYATQSHSFSPTESTLQAYCAPIAAAFGVEIDTETIVEYEHIIYVKLVEGWDPSALGISGQREQALLNSLAMTLQSNQPGSYGVYFEQGERSYSGGAAETYQYEDTFWLGNPPPQLGKVTAQQAIDILKDYVAGQIEKDPNTWYVYLTGPGIEYRSTLEYIDGRVCHIISLYKEDHPVDIFGVDDAQGSLIYMCSMEDGSWWLLEDKNEKMILPQS